MSWPNYRLMADISDNNAEFNAAQYASAGHVAVAIKATEGTNFTSPTYVKWVEAAHEHGLSVIHYHFAHPEDDNPVEQANYFHSVIEPHFRRPGDYCAFDVETGSYQQAQEFLRQADKRMRDISRMHPWVYAPLSYYDGAGLTVESGHVWLAAWGANEPHARHGETAVAWQFSDGAVGPVPHTFAGIGRADGSLINKKFADQLRKDYNRRRHPKK